MSWLSKIFTKRSAQDEAEDYGMPAVPTRNRHFGADPAARSLADQDDETVSDNHLADSPQDHAEPWGDGAQEQSASEDNAVSYAEYEQQDELKAEPVVQPARYTPASEAPAAAPARNGSANAEALPRFTTQGMVRAQNLQATADRMRPLRRAFTPSQPITEAALFAGRRELLQRLIHLIEDQGLHVVLYGDRGIGKTSLLRVLGELAEQGHYKVAYASCGSDTDFDSLFRSLARDVPLLFHSDFEPISPEVEAGQSFADLLPERAATVVDVTALFESLRGTHLLLFIDEFDRCESDRMREQVAELIKNLSDRGVSAQCVIAGVASNLTALVSHIPSIRRNLIGLPLGPLSETETREMMAAIAGRSGVPFSAAAVDRLVHFSNGLPYLNQLLGLHSAIVAVRAAHDEVTEGDVNAALSQALDEIRLRLSSRGLRSADNAGAQLGWDRLGELGRRALLQVGILHDKDLQGLPLHELNEILAYTSDEEGDRWTFKEEAVVPYVWMKSQVLAG